MYQKEAWLCVAGGRTQGLESKWNWDGGGRTGNLMAEEFSLELGNGEPGGHYWEMVTEIISTKSLKISKIQRVPHPASTCSIKFMPTCWF